jgi:hypothetical protein
MQNKKATFMYILAALLCFTIILTTACSQSSGTAPGENDVIPAQKFVGSKYLLMSEIGFDTFDEFVNFTTGLTNAHSNLNVDYIVNTGKIVVGTIDGVAEVKEGFLHDKKEGGVYDLPSYIYTIYNVIVEKTIFGEEVDFLQICLNGTPDSHFGMTKPDIGDNLVLLLNQNNSGTFTPVSYERSVFRINDDGTLYSFSDERITAQFDGETLDVLEDEIFEIMSKCEKIDILQEDGVLRAVVR